MVTHIRLVTLDTLSFILLIIAITGCNVGNGESDPNVVNGPSKLQADLTNPLDGTPIGLKSNANRFVVSFGPETEAQYRVNEQLMRRNLPNDAVGKTNDVSGMVAFDAEGNVVSEESKVTINSSTLKSDQGRRDNYIRMNTLQTNRFPTIEFVINDTPGLEWPFPDSGETLFKLVGDLTIRDVTEEITWNVNPNFNHGQIIGLATTSFTFDDFKLDMPLVAIVLSVENLIRLQLNFVANYPPE